VINDTYKGINTTFIALFADLTVMDPGFSQLARPSFGNEKKLSPLPLVPLLLHPNAAQDTIWNF
jgi:hypothetical protein